MPTIAPRAQHLHIVRGMSCMQTCVNNSLKTHASACTCVCEVGSRKRVRVQSSCKGKLFHLYLTHTHAHAHTHTHTHTRTRTHAHAHLHTHTHTYTLSKNVRLCRRVARCEPYAQHSDPPMQMQSDRQFPPTRHHARTHRQHLHTHTHKQRGN